MTPPPIAFATNETVPVVTVGNPVFYPDATGVTVPAGLHQMACRVDTSLMPSTQSISVEVQFDYGGGYGTGKGIGALGLPDLTGGTHTIRSGATVSYEEFHFPIQQADATLGLSYPVRARAAVLRNPASVTLSITGTVS